MFSGVPPEADRVSFIRRQRSDDIRQMKNLQDEATFLSSVFCHPITDPPPAQHLKPALLKKKIDISDPYFLNYLRDATRATLPLFFSCGNKV